ncbi:hypothetical protein SPHINGO361_100151 [Sphingomonas sp. EC-HK361]|nr:hypothetical protein SPHINGO361_100151 [Sphingomonas sp. EC-HK361]
MLSDVEALGARALRLRSGRTEVGQPDLKML